MFKKQKSLYSLIIWLEWYCVWTRFLNNNLYLKVLIFPSACRQGADVVFALDASGSVGEMNFRAEMDFVRELVLGINMIDSRIGVIKYSDNAENHFFLNDFSKFSPKS